MPDLLLTPLIFNKPIARVKDLIDAVFLALKCFLDEEKTIKIYNVGSLDKVNVKRIAEIVAEEMGLGNLKFRLTGGVDGERGWKGDVKTMLLSIDKLLGLGWKPTLKW